MKAQYSNLSILQGISLEDQELLLSMAKEVRFQAGDLILRDSDVASDFYVLVQGWVGIEMEVSTLELEQLTEDSGVVVPLPMLAPGQKVEATVLRSGEPFGEMGFLEKMRRSADVRAITSVVALQWDGIQLHHLLDTNHRLGYLFMKNLARLLAQRIRDVNLKWRSKI
jgi:CRP-like cAMP-binding protein